MSAAGVRRALLAVLAAGALGAGPALAQGGAGSMDGDVALLSRAGDSRAVGPDSAKVVLIAFIDFACPTCQAFYTQRADSLRRALQPDARLVYVNLLHANFLRSYHAAEAAMCAGGIGGRAAYAALADRLYRRAGEWTEVHDPSPAFTRYAREAGLDSAQFAECRTRDTVAPLLVSDMGTANTFGIAGTPTFVVVPQGARSAEDALLVSGNVAIAQLVELMDKARGRVP